MRLLLLLLLLSAPALAQEPAPQPPAAPAPPKGEQDPQRQAHLLALRGTTVHFDFRRAPLEDIAAALEKAAGVPVRVGAAAKRLLDKRKFKMRYVADRTGAQVLEDLAKAAALDVEVGPDGAVLDTPKEVKKLRTRLGLPQKEVRASGDDVAKMLTTKRLTLVARERPLQAVLDFLQTETGVRVVRLGADVPEGAAPPPEPKVTVTITDEPLGTVLDRVLQPLGWGWNRQGSVLLVGPAEVIAAQPKDEEEPVQPPR